MNFSVTLFADDNDLLVPFVVSELVKNHCMVTVVCQNPFIYQQYLQDVLGTTDFSAINFASTRATASQGADYILAIKSGSTIAAIGSTKAKLKIPAKRKIDYFAAARALALSSHGKLLEVHSLFSTPPNYPSSVTFYKSILVGELFAPSLQADNEIGSILKAAAAGKELEVSTASNQLFILDAHKAAMAIVKQVFSYWYSGKPTTHGLALKTTYAAVLEVLKQDNPRLTLHPKANFAKHLPVASVEYLQLRDKALDFGSTLKWWGAQKNLVLPAQTITNSTRTKHRRPVSQTRIKAILLTLIGFIWLALLPAMLLASSAVALRESVNQMLNANQATALPLLSYSETAGGLATAIFTKVDFFPSRPFAQVADLVSASAKLGQLSIGALSSLGELRAGVLGQQDYDLLALSAKLASSLDTVYAQSSLIEARLKGSAFLASFMPREVDVAQMRRYVWAAKELSHSLPTLLSTDKQKTYMVLLQNNMELRPTGGFIGSFALVTFDHGKLIDTTVFDVYTADGQLKGHVEPPTPIRDYLGEANWFLRDSNWDPDFPTSAERARWFLDKELDRQVDGVIAMDLHVVQSLLSYTGPIHLQDFDMELTDKNVYEKVQHEVESEFFPGSTKKASLLTALAKELLEQVTNENGRGLAADARLAQLLIDNLQEKHLIINLNDENAQQVIASLGWGGAVGSAACTDNCKDMWVHVNDANVGVNKANYHLEKSQNLKVEFGANAINYTLTVNLKNENKDSFALGGQYKSYLRVFVPQGEFRQGSIIQKNATVQFNPEIQNSEGRVSAGTVVSVAPGEESKITFVWSEVFDSASYPAGQPIVLRLIKQPGTDTTPTTIDFAMPRGRSIVANPAFDLTQARAFQYNTSLEQDFVSTFYFR